jgi:RNA-directed DNA polymerase
MSEDTPVNTGVGWPDPHEADLLVRKMQVKLHHWARADGSRRFPDLFNLVYDPAFLTVAWQRVSTNAGAKTPGVDRMTVSFIVNRIGVHTFLDHVRSELKSGSFRPVPVRQVMIPKASGKLRHLGIPTVTDRVVQAALKLVLEPVFEADFLPCSYGFRPMRRAQDAVAEIQHMTTRGYEWVLEADIQACFDTIDHGVLMARIRARIKDKKVLALVKAFLKAGVMTTTGDREDTFTGTPQGGILSPLLANIALTALDEHFDRQWRIEMATKYQRIRRRGKDLGNWRLVRYADDFVLVVNGHRQHAETLRDEVAEVIAPLGLCLAPDKTRVVHIDEGFDFLGWHIRRMRKPGTSQHYVYTIPSRKAQQAIRDRIRWRTRRSTLHHDLDELLLGLSRSLRGWANYFRHGVSSRVFSTVDYHAWLRIGAWIRRKHGRRLSWREVQRRFCDQGWRFAHNGVTFRGASSVAITRYRYRGARIPTPWTITVTSTADQ